MKKTTCAYCGEMATCEKEHVFPRCLYPSSKDKSKVQRLTVPACSDCNKSWTDNEAHFRDMLVMAGEKPNAVRQELWSTTTQRSFGKIDGPRRIQDLIAEMKPVMVGGNERFMVFPAKDERVMRVVEKVVRGLCYYHKVASPLSSKRIWANVLKYPVPQGFLDQMGYMHREHDIVEYKWQILNDEGINSIWLITFFERVTFVGVVSMSESGFD